MNEIRSIFYKEKEIILIDFSNSGMDREKTLAIVARVFPTLSARPKNSVLSLTNVTGMRFDKQILEAFKESVLQVKPYQKKSGGGRDERYSESRLYVYHDDDQ